MQISGIPTRLPLPWAFAGVPGTTIRSIPTGSQIGIQDGAASLTDGFPPLTLTPETSGGVPPFGQDTNGILNWITEICQWLQAGGQNPFDNTFSTQIGGYPKGAVVAQAAINGRYWVSTVDNNTSNPDAPGATNWVDYFAPVFSNPSFTGTLTSAGPAVLQSTLSVSGSANFTSTVSLGTQATAATKAPGDNTTAVATTAFVTGGLATLNTNLTNYVNGTFLTVASAAATYLTQANAAATYATISYVNGTFATPGYVNGQVAASLATAEAYTRSLVDGFSQPQGNSAIQNSGGGGSLTPSFTFTAPVAGVLWAWGSRNLSAQDASANLGQLIINGGVVAGDNTRDSMSHAWCAIIGPGVYTVEYSASALVAYSGSVGFLYVPYPPVY